MGPNARGLVSGVQFSAWNKTIYFTFLGTGDVSATKLKAWDIVGWTFNGACYCPAHKPPESDEVQPIFASDEGWEPMTCDVPHSEGPSPLWPIRFATLGDLA